MASEPIDDAAPTERATSTAKHSPFPARRSRLIERLDGATLLVSNLVNVRYLTGFTGSNAFLLVRDGMTLLLTDGRYVTQVASECPDVETAIRSVDSTMLDLLIAALQDHGVSNCLIESDTMTRALWRDLTAAADNVDFEDSTGIVAQIRAIKDQGELVQIRRSVAINEDAIRATLSKFCSSWTELEFSWQLEREIRERGGEGYSFDPIVAAGPASALPHYHPGSVVISDHSLLLIDWGTSFEGYASDLTRVVAIRSVPEKLLQIHQIVADAKQAAMETVRDGAELRTVDTAARQLIADAGFAEQFNHGLGHGFGLEIHETPFLSPAYDGQLRSGMVITIEPGIYLPGIGGVRLEDNILVTADGCERLNALPDDFLAV
ncbi:M24 family metallopeptidase [Mariniblastus fucicola]|uniref:Putative peptidase n=1 Tax=Mariniblastus fucicola TaxID=980251 RepID=A0A5B9PCK5_9BACT|nr:Xaa-Pro peptidase family protein [Mariniblastus fucicola]QEG23229.1 putative peptidase [Mariniblastus fucicola]